MCAVETGRNSLCADEAPQLWEILLQNVSMRTQQRRLLSELWLIVVRHHEDARFGM